ncbi:hypothetical protein HZB89_00215, partial [archaeon]|nr:hypothetical protein [archaeon]
LQTIRKLQGISVPEKEIIRSLVDSGLDEAKARNLIAEAGRPRQEIKEITTEEELEALIAGEEEKKKPKKEKAGVEFTPEELLKGMPLKARQAKQAKKEPEEEQPLSEELEEMAEAFMPEEEEAPLIEKQAVEKQARQAKKPVEAKPLAGEEQLWGEGILATINQKLEELDEKSRKFDLEATAKLDSELNKVKILFDSQKTLLLAKINASFEQKINEINGMTGDFEESLARMQEAKRLNEDIASKVNDKIKEVDLLRTDLMRKVNETLVAGRQETQEVLQKTIDEAKASRKMISDALALQSKIINGLLLDYEKKYADFLSGRKQEFEDFALTLNEAKQKKAGLEALSAEIDSRLNELDELNMKLEAKESELEKTLDAKAVEQKQKALKMVMEEGRHFVQETKSVVDSRGNELQSLIEARVRQIDSSVAEMINAEEKRFTEKINLFLSQKSAGLEESFEKKLDELSKVESVFSKDFTDLSESLKAKEFQAKKMFASVPVFALTASIALMLVMFITGFPQPLFLFGLTLAVLFFLFGVATLYLFVLKQEKKPKS